MSFVDGLRHRLRALVSRDAHEREVRDELAFHVELDAMQQRAGGLDGDAARRSARLSFGNETTVRESIRELSALRFFDGVARDFRYTLRTLRASPVFTAVSLLTLALGIGATATIFSLLVSILFAPLPVPRPDDLVQAQLSGARQTVDQFRYADYQALRDGRASADLAAYTGIVAIVHAAGTDDYAGIDIVTGSFFPVLGIRPRLGRLLDSADVAAGAPTVVVSEGYWRRVLNGDPAVVGKQITLGTTPFTIAGIVPAEYHGVGFPSNFQLAIPISAAALVAPNSSGESERMVWVIGRLRDGTTLATAAAMLDARFRGCCAERASAAGDGARITVRAIPQGIPSSKEDVRAEYRRLLYILMGGVLSLLLITCVNVANLLLSRAAVRRREFAVRLSLGASRARLIQQCLTESLVLSALGGALGVAVAYAAGNVLVARLSPETTAVLGDLVRFRASGPVLAFTAAISLAAGIAFGLAPAWRGTAVDLTNALRDGGRSASQRAGTWLRRAFIVSQFVFTLLLVVLAGLFARSLQNLRNDDLGFKKTNSVIAFIDPRGTLYTSRPLSPLYERILAGASALPGVRSASVSSYTPILGGANMRSSITVPGYTAAPGEGYPQFDYVSSAFFGGVGLRFTAGRAFTPAEEHGAEHIAVVNQAFAKHYFGTADATGRQFRFPDPVTIVGVVADARFNGPGSSVDPMVFIPYVQWPDDWSYLALTLQTTGDPASTMRAVKHLIDDVAPGIRVRSVTTLEQQLDRSLERQRLAAGLAALFGTLALCLAAVGLYGVVAYLVTARTGEFGLRLALGARPHDLFWLILRESLTLSALGIAFGLPLAFAGARLVTAQLYGVGAADPVTAIGAIVMLAAVAVVAGLVPAARASRVDPLEALRAE
ncbi:MAG TPA: ABC transporter permease [Gemmatimonadaceae bacterium]|nr:ABC transporter permease [Gemmatimonadaceae bacterium]